MNYLVFIPAKHLLTYTINYKCQTRVPPAGEEGTTGKPLRFKSNLMHGENVRFLV